MTVVRDIVEDVSQDVVVGLEGAGQSLNANYWLNSEDMSAATPLRSTTTNDVIFAPNGTLTADKVAATVASSSRVSQILTLEEGKNILSVYAKPGNVNFIALRLINTDYNISQFFDVATGATGGQIGSDNAPKSFGIEPAPDGWYRCWIEVESDVDLTGTLCVYLSKTIANFIMAVDDFLFLWGAQVNAGDHQKYIKTEGSATADLSNTTPVPAAMAPNKLTAGTENDLTLWTPQQSPIVTANTIEDDNASAYELVTSVPSDIVHGVGNKQFFSCRVLKDAVAKSTRYPLIRINQATDKDLMIDTQLGDYEDRLSSWDELAVVDDGQGYWLVQGVYTGDQATGNIQLYPAVGSSGDATWPFDGATVGTVEFRDILLREHNLQ